jgi:Putative polyhydroxyalkanoic acid system protein (PHA_gran_rgn)
MPNLTMSIPHQLSRAEVKRRIQDQTAKLRHQYGSMVTDVHEIWSDDDLDFSVTAMGQTIYGGLKIDDSAVHLTVALPWLLSVMAGAVKHRIEQQGRRLLSHDHARTA